MFNENEYKREWKKENMKMVRASFKKDFVDQFKEACKQLNAHSSRMPLRSNGTDNRKSKK